ncbi:MAG TPA: sporulation integral membrane protein YlbJ [Peptococcaceae bacterium]|nr:sporulation integral membrane protein YlbJ [Peptococcaceae bacterium]
MFYYPQDVLKSAATGLALWANYVLPALLPFFIISDLLMKQGFVHFLGVLLEPLMRPLFRLPGQASFVLAMTHTTGIPIGAMLTCKMRNAGEISKTEGERLLAFTSNPSPGFMFGAVASGMLGNPSLGIIIAGSVYLANLLVGFIFRFYGPAAANPSNSKFSLITAYQKLKQAQNKNKKPFGELLADTVRDSIATILLVGGFIVFFAVITQMLTKLKINITIAKVLAFISGELLTVPGGEAFLQGLLETTLGCQATVKAFSNLNTQIGVLTFLLGFGGLSVFAQVASFTATTDLRFFPFILGRVLHAFLALLISQILLRSSTLPTTVLPASLTEGTAFWVLSLKWSLFFFSLVSFLLLVLALTSLVLRKAIFPRS